jgi:hypothetical protein
MGNQNFRTSKFTKAWLVQATFRCSCDCHYGGGWHCLWQSAAPHSRGSSISDIRKVSNIRLRTSRITKLHSMGFISIDKLSKCEPRFNKYLHYNPCVIFKDQDSYRSGISLIPNENCYFPQVLQINIEQYFGKGKDYILLWLKLMTTLHFSFGVKQTSAAETAQLIYGININLLILHI